MLGMQTVAFENKYANDEEKWSTKENDQQKLIWIQFGEQKNILQYLPIQL